MKSVTKRIMIYSMLGMMQLGLGATVGATLIEASASNNDGSQIIQLDSGDYPDNNSHDQRQRQENDRHQLEMRRHDHESDRDWHNRQNRENQRHNLFR